MKKYIIIIPFIFLLISGCEKDIDVEDSTSDLSIADKEECLINLETEPIDIPGVADIRNLEIFDFDNDNDLDIALREDNGILFMTTKRISLFKNDGVGGFERHALGDDLQNFEVNCFRVYDYNKDGLKDIVASASLLFSGAGDESSIHLFKNNGHDFVFDRKINFGMPVKDFVIGDVNFDGNDDVLFSSFSYGEGAIYLAENIGNFNLNKAVPISNKFQGGDFSVLTSTKLSLKDVDSDGKIDIIFSGNNDEFYIIKNTYPNLSVMLKLEGVKTIKIDDFDLDGSMDIVALGDKEQGVYKQINSSFKKVSDLPKMRSCDATWCDLNNDNKKDLIVSYAPASSDIYVFKHFIKFYICSDDNKFIEVQLPQTQNIGLGGIFSQDMIQCADIDNDKKDDLIISAYFEEGAKSRNLNLFFNRWIEN